MNTYLKSKKHTGNQLEKGRLYNLIIFYWIFKGNEIEEQPKYITGKNI